jgi:hypothetical protein
MSSTHKHTHTSECNLRTGRRIREAAKRDAASGKHCRRAWRQILPPSCTRKMTTVAARSSSVSVPPASARARRPLASRASTTRSCKYQFVSSLIKGKGSYVLCLTFLHGRKPQVCIIHINMGNGQFLVKVPHSESYAT